MFKEFAAVVVITGILTAVNLAQAQQPTKIPRIGYLDGCLPFR